MINKDEEREGVKSPVLPAMALGGGLLGLGAAQGLASDEQINRFRTAYNEYNPAAFGDPSQLPPNNTDLTYYERTMSPGAQFKPFGKPIGDLLVKVRSSEKLMGKEPIVDIDKLREGKYTKYLAQLIDRLGLTEPLTSGLNTASYHLGTPDQQHGVSGGAHYRMFGNGPIPAYVHQMKAKYPSTNVPEELGVPEGTNYTDWMGRKLEDFLTDATGQRTNPYEFTTDLRSHEDQLKLMEDFHASLSPEEQAFRTQVEDLDAAKYQSQTSNYLPKAKAFADFRDTLKDVGITAGGAGLGGLLGHYLHRLAGGENEGRDLSHMAATGAGMGLGGLAGYFGGTQAGRQKVLDLLAKFKKESGDLMTLGLFFDDPKIAGLTRSAVGESGLSVNMAPWSLQGEDAWPSAESYHTGRRRADSLLPPGMKGTPIKPIENTYGKTGVYATRPGKSTFGAMHNLGHGVANAPASTGTTIGLGSQPAAETKAAAMSLPSNTLMMLGGKDAAAVKVAPSFSRQAKGKPDGPYQPGHTYQGSKTKKGEELVDATEMAANAQEAEMSADELADQTEEILEDATKCGGLIVPFALMDDPFEKESGAAGVMGRLGGYADDVAAGAKAVGRYGDDAARLAAKVPKPGTMGNYARSAAGTAGTTARAIPTAAGAMGAGARTAGTAGQTASSVGRAATSTGRIGRAARRVRDSRVGDAARWVRKSPMVAQPLLQGGIGTGVGMGMDYARESDIEGETWGEYLRRPFRHRLDKTDPNFSHYSNTAILGASGLASGLASGAMLKGLGPKHWASKAVPVTAAGTAAYRGTGAAMAAGERAAYNMASATNAAKMVEEFGNDPSSQPFIPFLFDENGNQDLEGMGARFTRAMHDREYFQRIAPEALALMDQGIAQGSFAALAPLISEAGPTLAKMFPDIFFDENGQPIQPENMEDLIGMVSQIGERFEGQDKGQIMMSMLSGMEPEQMATAFAEMQSTPEGQAFLQELAKQPKMKETVQSLMGGDGGGAMMMLDGIMGNFMGDFWKNMTGSQKMFFGLAIGSGILGILGTMSGSGLMGGAGLLAGLLFGGLSLFGNQIGDAIGGPVGEFIGGGQQTPPGTAAAEGGETAAPGVNEGKVTSQDVIEKMRRKNKPTEKMRQKIKAPAAEPFVPGAGIAAG